MSSERLYFIDLDGVIIDSVVECFEVAWEVFQNLDSGIDADSLASFRQVFIEHRGLVGPPEQYLVLMKTIQQSVHKNKDSKHNSASNFATRFAEIGSELNATEKTDFRERFFNCRKNRLANPEQWISLNPLTGFGDFLKSVPLKKHIVLTTKNRLAANTALDMHRLEFKQVIANEDFGDLPSKGAVIKSYLDAGQEDTEAWFIDDFEPHLSTVDDSRITPWFADWGYGFSSGRYQNFNRQMWELIAQ